MLISIHEIWEKMTENEGGMKMLIETRLNTIVNIVEEKGSVTIQELMELMDVSESTIRRSIKTLDKAGRLVKVHGGAIAIDTGIGTKDNDVISRQKLNREDKIKIAKYAASIIKPNEFIFIDAGTTTEILAEMITDKSVTVVTNGISHAKILAAKGITTFLLGGMLKQTTEAVVGEEAIRSLNKYNFTKGFFGTNGIGISNGFSTPEDREAILKENAMSRSKEVFILADKSKFEFVSSVRFGEFRDATIITTNLNSDKYKMCANVVEV